MSLLNKLREIKENRKEKKEERKAEKTEEIQKHNARIDNAYFLFSPFVEEDKREEFKALVKKAMNGDLKAYTEFAETMEIALKRFSELKIDKYGGLNRVYTVGTALDKNLNADKDTEISILTLLDQYFPSTDEDFEEVKAEVESASSLNHFDGIKIEVAFAKNMYRDIMQDISKLEISNVSKVKGLSQDISYFQTNIKADPMAFLLMNPKYVYVLNNFLKNELDIVKEKVKDNWQKCRYNFILSDIYADFFDESGATLVCPPATLAMLLLTGILGIIDAGVELVVGTPRVILSKLKSKNIEANQDLIKALNEMYGEKVKKADYVSDANKLASEKINSYLTTDADYLCSEAQSRLEELSEQYEEWSKIKQNIYKKVETRLDKYLTTLIETNDQDFPELNYLIQDLASFILHNRSKYFSEDFIKKLEDIAQEKISDFSLFDSLNDEQVKTLKSVLGLE